VEVPSGGGQTVLIVEDDELVRPSVENLIASLGYRVLSARNGDLLFTDVFMPGGMYGPKLVAEARRLRPQLKVLYTSGYEDFTPDPGFERLIKPYWPEHLAAKLRKVLESHI
jgi:CheY-like chemotaxis protein